MAKMLLKLSLKMQGLHKYHTFIECLGKIFVHYCNSACLQTTLAFKENDLQLFANKMQVMLGWVWYWRPYNSV